MSERYYVARKRTKDLTPLYHGTQGWASVVLDREQPDKFRMIYLDRCLGGKERSLDAANGEAEWMNKDLERKAAEETARKQRLEQFKDLLVQVGATPKDLAEAIAELLPAISPEDWRNALVEALDLRAQQEWNVSHVKAHEYAAQAHKLAQVQLN